MSWSINFIGSPNNIVAALDKHSEELTGQSKEEFKIAKSLLACLVQQNYNNNDQAPPVIMHLKAYGSNHTSEGQPIYGNLTVDLSFLNGTLV